MNGSLCVLAVGARHLHRQVGLALSQKFGCELSIANDCRELWVVPRDKPFQVAIMDAGVATSQLEEACRFVRHRWPSARIILVHPALEFLEDDLYDERLHPEDISAILLATIERLTQRAGQNITTKE